MTGSRFPHGIITPWSTGGGRFSNPWSTHYFVDARAGASGPGKTPEEAVKTIQEAVNLAVGGDVIYIRPQAYTLATGFARYTEDIVVSQGGTTGSGNTATNANISIIGITARVGAATDFLGVRSKYSSATNLTIRAPGTHIENIGFFSEDATYGVHFESGSSYTYQGPVGSSIYNCAIKGDGGLFANHSDELQIVNCRFQAKYDGTVSAIVIGDNSTQVKRPIIKGCEFIGGNANNMSGPCISFPYAPVYDAMVRNNYFSVIPDGGVYISIAGTSSDGLFADNYFAAADINARCTGLVAGVSGIFSAAMYDQTGLDDFAS